MKKLKIKKKSWVVFNKTLIEKIRKKRIRKDSDDIGLEERRVINKNIN